MTTLFSKSYTLNKFNISSATLDNWIRTSIPDALSNNLYDVEKIKKFIQSNNKLSARANKKKNSKIEVSKDLIAYLKDDSWIPRFTQYLESNSQILGLDIVHLMNKRHFPDDFLITEKDFTVELDEIIPNDDYYAYGVAYQIILSSGEKSEKGAYYTPPKIVRNIVSKLVAKDKTFLEPCAGVGFFVVEYILEYQKQFKCWPENLIFANELDSIAAKICELTIKLATQHNLKSFLVLQGDGLELAFNNFDLIITNPPYGIKNKYAHLKSTEIFTHFIHKCLDSYLTLDGILHFVLPSSILYVEKHKEIRKYILEHHTVHKIENYGRGFSDVFSDIISLEIIKKSPSKNSSIELQPGCKQVNQESLRKDSFIITLSDDIENSTINKYYEFNHILLKDCIFALGIVTGNNKQFVSPTYQEGFRKVISGKEVKLGELDTSNIQYVLDNPDKYQQHPPMDIFDKKKIIYKFISKYIISSVDTEKHLTLNSANLLVLKDLPVSEEYVSAILNSDVMQTIFQTKFGNPIKVLKKHLQEFPIFIFKTDEIKQIEDNYKLGKHKENNLFIEKLLNTNT